MTITKKVIDSQYKDLHDKLSKKYYEDEAISKKVFQQIHSRCWWLHAIALLELGYIPNQIDSDTEISQLDQIKEKLLKQPKPNWEGLSLPDPEV